MDIVLSVTLTIVVTTFYFFFTFNNIRCKHKQQNVGRSEVIRGEIFGVEKLC